MTAPKRSRDAGWQVRIWIRVRARAIGQDQRQSGRHPAKLQHRGRFEAKAGKPSQGQHWGGPRQSTGTAAAQLQWRGPVVQPQLNSTSQGRRGRPSLLPFFTIALPSRGPGLGLSQLDSNLASQLLEGRCACSYLGVTQCRLTCLSFVKFCEWPDIMLGLAQMNL